MKDEELKAQINDIIEGEIQNGINDYLEEKEGKQKEQGMGFVNPTEGDELKVNIMKDEIDNIIREYKKIKKRKRSNLHQVKLLDSRGKPLK